MKVLRAGFSDRLHLWLALLLAVLVHHYDAAAASRGVLLDLFLLTLAVRKGMELMRKLGFAYTYSAPWNNRDVLGSGFHALMYPLQVPHAAMLILQVFATIDVETVNALLCRCIACCIMGERIRSMYT